MSDLKLAADGATRRYDMMNGTGTLPRSEQERLSFLAWLGEYDLHWDELNECYAVARPRPVGGEKRHNFTDYFLNGDNLEPADKDVVLDPYHMGLLYQAHEHFGYEA